MVAYWSRTCGCSGHYNPSECFLSHSHGPSLPQSCSDFPTSDLIRLQISLMLSFSVSNIASAFWLQQSPNLIEHCHRNLPKPLTVPRAPNLKI